MQVSATNPPSAPIEAPGVWSGRVDGEAVPPTCGAGASEAGCNASESPVPCLPPAR
jgi:hypothetical protein